jgi:hypothetical protein
MTKVISFPLFGNLARGRLGNQFFQHLALEIVASKLGAKIIRPAGEIDYILDENSKSFIEYSKQCLPRSSIPLISEKDVTNPEELITKAKELFDQSNEIQLDGFFQFHTSHLRSYLTEFKKKFRRELNLDAPIDTSKKYIGIHYRLGDYTHYPQDASTPYQISCPKALLDTVQLIKCDTWFSKSKVFVCTDSPDLASSLLGSEFDHSLRQKIGTARDNQEKLAEDFSLLARADAVIISNSTFSVSACLLNSNAKMFFRPNLVTRHFEMFDPRYTDVLYGMRSINKGLVNGRY